MSRQESGPHDPDVGLPIVLASASPRRRDLLTRAGLVFDVLPADVDESIDASLSAGAAAEDLSLRKARVIAARMTTSALVIGSDTLVVLGEDGSPARRYLEKAADAAEATSMLEALSGTRHRVVTGVAVVRVWPAGGGMGDAAGGVGTLSGTLSGTQCSELVDHETTFVTMRPLSRSEIDAYVASGEWRGKAGSYAIQESADRFVDALEGGGFDNVVGLPVERTLRLLRAATER